MENFHAEYDFDANFYVLSNLTSLFDADVEPLAVYIHLFGKK